ncbi:MAG: nucleotidyl transferase AbiEii/AbiGii toxin family protein [Candidatus Xenobiia bacterium LiM19]
MLEPYQCHSVDDYRNAINEIVQEIALLGLYRGGFYNRAALYGGTALRIFHGVKRFSEDPDFSLIKPDRSFELSRFTPVVQDEFGAYGFEMTVEEKINKSSSPVKSAFFKGSTQIHLLKIASVKPPVSGVHADEMIKIKLEVDVDPPSGALYEMRYQLIPVPYNVRVFSPSSLFAGKVHAILCRSQKSRVNGRDFYDYIWYLSKDIPVNIHHLTMRMRQSGHLEAEETLDDDKLRQRLCERFKTLDFRQAREDIIPFIKDRREIEIWSSDFFSSVTRDRLRIA